LHLSDVACSGSIVRQGEMNALVVATGMNNLGYEEFKVCRCLLNDSMIFCEEPDMI
jgi:hypothetical protein